VVGEDRRALATQLRQLAEWEIRDAEDLAQWYAAAQALNDWLRAPRSVSVPRELWRWLADADLRLENADCAREQDAFVRRYINELESVPD
jgi:hypothetical protein